MCQEAEQLINARNFKQAIRVLRKAEQADPEAGEVHGYLGMAYQNSLDTQKAIIEYKKALELNPSMSFIKINLGTCYMNAGRLDLAVPYLEQYLQENPNAPERTQVEGYLRQAGTRRSQNNMRSSMERGQAQLNSGRTREAINTFSQVIRNNPEWAPGHFYMGYALAKSGDHSQAINEFKRALSLDPSQKESIINIASNYQSMGEANSAIQWYQRYLRENPGSPKARDIAGRIKGLEQQARQNPGQGRRSPGQMGGAYQGGSGWQRAQGNAPDYLASAASGGKFFRWAPDAIPIKVFIANGQSVPGYQPFYQKTLMDAFSTWATATGNKLLFSLAPDIRSANIICQWTDNPNQVMDRGRLVEGGLTRLSGQTLSDGQSVAITRATMTILTTPGEPGQPMSQDQFTKVCLHEVGHAIGINGHSNNNQDIMFFSESPSIWPALTNRDKATAMKLYETYPVRP